jgi:Na+-transporting NADH:ubiquinone oxidoreductase subunit C
MAGRNKTRERVLTLVFMLAATLIIVGAVAGAYLATADRIHSNASLYLKRAVLKAAGLSVPTEIKGVEALYTSRIRPEGEPPAAFAVMDEAGTAPTGRVLLESGAGLWGPIRAVVGFDVTHGRVTGIEFIEQGETPGLGARIEEDWFKAQFKGKKGPFTRLPEGTRSNRENEFDAITGATITSRAVEDILNRSVAKLKP